MNLPEEEVATSPSDQQPETAKALMGQFEIEALLGSGPMVDRVTGKIGIFKVVSFLHCLTCDFFKLSSHCRFNGKTVWYEAEISTPTNRLLMVYRLVLRNFLKPTILRTERIQMNLSIAVSVVRITYTREVSGAMNRHVRDLVAPSTVVPKTAWTLKTALDKRITLLGLMGGLEIRKASVDRSQRKTNQHD